MFEISIEIITIGALALLLISVTPIIYFTKKQKKSTYRSKRLPLYRHLKEKSG